MKTEKDSLRLEKKSYDHLTVLARDKRRVCKMRYFIDGLFYSSTNLAHNIYYVIFLPLLFMEKTNKNIYLHS